MKNLELQHVLECLHEESAKLLLERIRDKSATPADIGRAVDLLRNSGIALEIDTGTAADQLHDQMREFDAAQAADPYAKHH